MTLLAPCFMLYFIPGLIADVWCGRFRVILVSFEVVWFGALFLTLGAGFYTATPETKFYISTVATAVVYIGKAGFEANVLQFGCDQLADAPSSDLSSFISWSVWSNNVGFASGFILSYTLYSAIKQFSVMISGLVVSLGFCLTLTTHFCWSHKWLMIEAQPINPYRSVYNVLKYAWKHKHPEKRSSLTYWEEGLPSRIDLGKSKYGGPFTVEQVEDVKTFGRILCILVFAVVSLVGYGPVIFGEFVFFFHLGINNDSFALSAIKNRQFCVYCTILMVPIYEVLLSVPLLKKYAPSSLVSIQLALILVTLSVFSNFLLDAVGHRISAYDVECLFDYNELKNTTLSLSRLTAILPVVPGSLGYTIGYISILKFLVAQSPKHMTGMFIGLFYSLWGLATFVGFMVALPFFLAYPQVTNSSGLSCGSAYYLLCSIICAFGTFCSAVLAKQYKYRLREEVLGNEQQFAVSYYST